MMNPHDQERFGAFVGDFVDRCGIEPPFTLVALSANGSVSVSQYSGSGSIAEVCSHTVKPGFVSPITVTVISFDGRGATARIEIETARATMQ